MQPEEARDAVRVPGREDGGGNAGEVGEDRHRARERERGGRREQAERGPRAPPERGVRVDVAAVAEEAHEDELRRRVRVERAAAGGARGSAVGEKFFRSEFEFCPVSALGRWWREWDGRTDMRKLTMPIPKVTFDQTGDRENSAGDATVLPIRTYITTLKTAYSVIENPCSKHAA